MKYLRFIILVNLITKKSSLLSNSFIPCREKAEAEIQTLLDEGSHKYDFFLDMWDLGKNFQFIS